MSDETERRKTETKLPAVTPSAEKSQPAKVADATKSPEGVSLPGARPRMGETSTGMVDRKHEHAQLVAEKLADAGTATDMADVYLMSAAFVGQKIANGIDAVKNKFRGEKADEKPKPEPAAETKAAQEQKEQPSTTHQPRGRERYKG